VRPGGKVFNLMKPALADKRDSESANPTLKAVTRRLDRIEEARLNTRLMVSVPRVASSLRLIDVIHRGAENGGV